MQILANEKVLTAEPDEKIVLTIELDLAAAKVLARICTRHSTVNAFLRAKDGYKDNAINELLAHLWYAGLLEFQDEKGA